MFDGGFFDLKKTFMQGTTAGSFFSRSKARAKMVAGEKHYIFQHGEAEKKNKKTKKPFFLLKKHLPQEASHSLDPDHFGM